MELKIFDISGREIRTLVQQNQPTGNYEIEWDGTTQTGIPVPGGVYLYRLKAGNFVQTKKMVYAR